MTETQVPLEEMTLRQLRRVASALGVSRYSRMRKDQLLSAIVSLQGEAAAPSSAQTLTQANTQPSTQTVTQGMDQPYTQANTQPGTQTSTIEPLDFQSLVEAAKFDVGAPADVTLADVDEGLPEFPEGYGESRIVLLPRDPRWAYAYWDVPNEHKEHVRSQGGQQLALRLYDVTDINMAYQAAHSVQEYPCDELAREWYLPVPVSDRDYAIEIGYRTWDGRWLTLARSAAIRIPPVYPSEWIEDHFMTVSWDDDLRGKQLMTLVPPSQKPMMAGFEAGGREAVFGLSSEAEALRMAGSLFGSMQHVPGSVAGSIQHVEQIETISSYVFPSGVGMWAVPTASGLNMSGVGFSASAPPIRPRQFWLIADAELIVYGATEPDATVYVDGEPIKLNSDGTFRFQMSFQDGVLNFPVFAVAADGEQNRAIHMKFERQTLQRRTNTKEEAVQEWLV
jgi:hypothetical protein